MSENKQIDMYYEEMPMQIRIDNIVSDRYDDIGVNLIECQITKALDEELYKLFIASPFYEAYKGNDRKADKADSVRIFKYFNGLLGESYTYSLVDKFLAIAEFFSINYKVLFSELDILQQEEIVREMSKRHKIGDKIKRKRIF